jgi:hypothetical protein
MTPRSVMKAETRTALSSIPSNPASACSKFIAQ